MDEQLFMTEQAVLVSEPLCGRNASGCMNSGCGDTKRKQLHGLAVIRAGQLHERAVE
jgi:hypothetical protein